VAVLPRAEDKNMSLLDHLEELRHRLLRCVIAFVIGTLAGYFLADTANGLLVRPFEQAGLGQREVVPDQVARLTLSPDGTLRLADPAAVKSAEGAPPRELRQLEIVDVETGQVVARVGSAPASGLVFLKPMDPLMIRMKTAMILGGIFAFPVILWQLLAFVAPGLYDHERRAFAPMIVMALLLFPAGVVFAYVTLKYAIVFLAQYGFAHVGFMNDARAYLGFALSTLVVCGAVAELPVLVMILVRLGIVSPETLAAKRRIIFVGILLVSSVLTPPDPFSLLVMAFPLYGLFELSLLLSRTTAPKRVASDTLEPSKA